MRARGWESAGAWWVPEFGALRCTTWLVVRLTATGVM